MLNSTNICMRLLLFQMLVGAAAQRRALKESAHAWLAVEAASCKQYAPALALHNTGFGSLQARQPGCGT